MHVHDLARDARWLHAELDRDADRRGLAVTDREPARHARVARVHVRPTRGSRRTRTRPSRRARFRAARCARSRTAPTRGTRRRRPAGRSTPASVPAGRRAGRIADRPGGSAHAVSSVAATRVEGRAASVRVCASSASASTTVSSRRRTAAVSAEYSGVPESRNGFGRTGSGGTGESYPAPRNAPGTVQAMEFRRINAPAAVRASAIMDALKIEARRAGEDVIDLGFGNPDIPSPDIAVEEARRGGARTRATTGTRRAGASRSCALAITDLYRRKFGVELDPETAGVHHHRRQGGLLAPDVGAARPGRRRAGAEPVVPDPHLGPDPRRRRGAPRAPRARPGLLRQPARGVGRLVAAAARRSCSRSRTTRRPRASTSSS